VELQVNKERLERLVPVEIWDNRDRPDHKVPKDHVDSLVPQGH